MTAFSAHALDTDPYTMDTADVVIDTASDTYPPLGDPFLAPPTPPDGEDGAGDNPTPTVRMSPFERRARASELPVNDITGHVAPWR